MTRKEFYKRWAEIEDKIPTDFINKSLLKDPTLNASRVQNVRYGKTADEYILFILESIVKEELESETK